MHFCLLRNNYFLLSILLIFIHFNFILSEEYSLIFRIYTPNALTIEITSGQDVEKITTMSSSDDVQTYSNWVYPKPRDIIKFKALNGITSAGDYGELPTGISGTIQIGGFVIDLVNTPSFLKSSDNQYVIYNIPNSEGTILNYFVVDATAYIYI